MNKPLSKIVIAYESQLSWQQRPNQQQIPSEMKAQLDHYLPSPIQIAELVGTVSIAAAKLGIDVETILIDDLENAMRKFRLTNRHGTCVWIISDGHKFHHSGPINAWLKLVGIPYYGIDTTLQSLTDNKYLMSVVMSNHGINIPKSWLFNGSQELAFTDGLDCKKGYFVKPNTLGSQVGISRNSWVQTFDNAVAICKNLKSTLNVDALIQSYIEGSDYRVSAVDTKKHGLKFACVGVQVENEDGKIEPFSSNKALSGRRWIFDTDNLETDTRYKQAETVLSVLKRLGLMRDYCGVDLRGDSTGDLVFLENNVKPFATIAPHAPLAEILGFNSVGELFVNSILKRFEAGF